MPSVSEFGMTITMTPVVSWEDAVAALDLVTHADTNFDPSLTDSTVEKLRKYTSRGYPKVTSYITRGTSKKNGR